jgi:hypothetical protein
MSGSSLHELTYVNELTCGNLSYLNVNSAPERFRPLLLYSIRFIVKDVEHNYR